MSFDVTVIGGGPGGYVAAIRCAQLGLSTTLVERDKLGGICLNWGCIPTKALLKCAEVLKQVKEAEAFGIMASDVKFDLEKMVNYSRAVSAKLAKGVEALMKKNGVEIVHGTGSIKSKGVISVTNNGQEHLLNTKNVIIATGAAPRDVPGITADGNLIWNYKHAMMPKQLPRSILIVGSGAIGVEFASFYNMLGVDVTIIEIADQILPHEDKEIAGMAAKEFSSRGIKIFTGSKVTSAKTTGEAVLVTWTDDRGEIKESNFAKVILAVGVVPNISGIGLENTKVELERGVIKTNQYQQTAEEWIYAIGDVVSPPWLAHKASHEGIICASHIKGHEVHGIERHNIPACTYTYPQIASIGMKEEEAKAKHAEIKVGRFPLYANGKAIALNEAIGMVKTIFDAKSGELLGAHMIGPEVTEIIGILSIAKSMEATEEDIINAIIPHPTVSESITESVLAAWGRGIHI